MSPYHRVKSMTLTVLQSLPRENSVLFRENKRKKEPFENLSPAKFFIN